MLVFVPLFELIEAIKNIKNESRQTSVGTALQQYHKQNCFALKKKCNNYGILNRFAKMCRKPEIKATKSVRNNENNTETEDGTIINMENYKKKHLRFRLDFIRRNSPT